MATAPTAPADVLLRLLSPPPSNNTAITNHQQQQQGKSKTPRFLSLSLSPASKVVAKGRSTKRARPDGAFQCRTCGRRFATFQALGGHRTSHNRARVRADGLDLVLGARSDGKAAAAKGSVHRCHTCGAVFPSGQALGGHMRRHRAAAETEMAIVGLSSQEMDWENDECSALIHFI